MGQKVGCGYAPFRWGSGPRPTFVPFGILIHPAVWPQQTWAENWGLCPFFGGGLGPHLHNVAWSETYFHAKWHLDPSTHLATRYMGRKFGGSAPFSGEGELGLTWAKACLPTKCHLDPSSHLATTDMGRKLGGCAPLGEGSWVPI